MTDTSQTSAGGNIAIEDNTFTPEQTAQLEAWAREDGNLPQGDPSIQASPDDAAQTVDLGPQPDVFGGQVRPTDYRFEAPAPGQESMPLQQVQEISTALAAAGIPADLGREFGRRWNKVMASPIPTDSELELGMQQADAQLRQVYGNEADDMLRLARGEAKRLAKRNPMIRAALENTQLGNDAWVCATLANLGRARQARK